LGYRVLAARVSRAIERDTSPDDPLPKVNTDRTESNDTPVAINVNLLMANQPARNKAV
jgi:hypothetical protein